MCEDLKMKIILNGLTLDKEKMHNVIKSIDDDADIKKLIRTSRYNVHGKFLWTFVLGLIPLILYVYYQFFSIKQMLIEDSISATAINYLNTYYMYVVIPIVLYLINDFRSFIIRIKNSTNEVFEYLIFIFDKKSPRRPLDMWGFFLSNLSDSHSLIPATKLLDDNIKYIYCGLPYYDVEYIDSILIRVTPKIKKTYVKFYKDFAIESYDNVRKNIIRGEKKILQTKHVFGIFFFSKFLFTILQDHVAENGKLIINFNLSLKNEKKLEFIKECVKLCSDPNITSFDSGSSDKESINIIVEDIFMLRDKKPKLRKNQILIPFKRFIALPINYGGNSKYKKPVDSNLILPEIPEFYSSKNMKNEAVEESNETVGANISELKPKESVIKIYSMGGTEHNLPLLHIVNHHRWSKKDSRFFGIAENKFDEAIIEKEDEISQQIKRNSREKREKLEYNVGASHFVFGINAKVRHRNLGFNNEAEVFRFKIKNDRTYDILSFYGYSAPMTRIALLKYLHEVKINPETPFEPKLEENGEESDGAYKLYRVGNENDNIFDSEFLAHWDKFDCMNNPSKFHELSKDIEIVTIHP